MRCVIATATALLMLLAPVCAAPSRIGEASSAETVLRWINGYRSHPEVAGVPAAVRALSRLGAFKDPETSGVYVGFIAGVLNANPAIAEDIVEKMLPLPPENQWVIVRAIAYSGLPEWKQLMREFSDRMPTRKAMIDRYYSGRLPTLDHVSFAKDPTLLDKIRRHLSSTKESKPVTMEPSAELLDTLWGYYFATGSYGPIARIIAMLPWAKDKDNLDKLTLGSMAKYTLASNASHDASLLAMLKWASQHQDKETTAILDDAIDAAETVEIARVRKQQMVAIDDLRRKGPGSKRDVAMLGQLGESAVGLGCIAAAATGQVQFGLPCVLGGAATSAAVRFWAGQ